VRAISYRRFGGPEVLEFGDLPEPEIGAQEILVRLHAASVIPADWKLRQGHLKDLFSVRFPKIPGRDGAGIVVAIGSGVDRFRVGDRVAVVAQHGEQGTYAELIVRKPEAVTALPEGLGFAQGAAVMHAGICAWTALVRTAQLSPGMRVLVHGGAGAIGGLAVQLARHLGAEVTATCRAVNVDYVRGLGAHCAIAYDREDFTALPHRQDVVLDLVGGAVHERSYAVLRPGGHLVNLIAAPIVDRAQQYGVRRTEVRIDDAPEVLDAVMALTRSKAWVPQIARIMPLADAGAAQNLLQSGAISRGRIILRIGDGVVDGPIRS
jgi:NADPH:quinone reductase-like Zn-dependent oxidoreductase